MFALLHWVSEKKTEVCPTSYVFPLFPLKVAWSGKAPITPLLRRVNRGHLGDVIHVILLCVAESFSRLGLGVVAKCIHDADHMLQIWS